jgi:hypothetical protein
MTKAKLFPSGNSQPPPRADWPPDFWRAFKGMPKDFERPAQVLQRRGHVSS